MEHRAPRVCGPADVAESERWCTGILFEVEGIVEFSPVDDTGDPLVDWFFELRSHVQAEDTGDFSGADNLRDIKVALSGVGRAYANGFIGKFEIWGVFVSLGVNRYCLDAKFMTGPDHTQRYLATICY